MTPSTSRKLLVLGALYAAQGLPFGFFTQALPSLLREQGLSLEMIGAASVLGVPWAAKALWAPAVERWGSPRRWIAALQLASVVGLVVLSFITPTTQIAALSFVVFAMNLFAATQDVATDGMAVASLTHDERGLGNGLQVAGYRVGMILGGGALLVAYDHLGWRATLWVMAGITALLWLPLGLSPRMGADATHTEADPSPGWDWFWRPGAVPWLAVLVAAKVGDYVVQGMLRPWLVDAGMSLSEIGVVLGGVGFTAGLVGALVGGWATRPLGHVRALVLFGALQALSLGGYAVAAGTGWGIWPAVLAEHFLGGCATAALFTAMMDASRRDHGATDFTIQASVVVVASLAGATVSGVLAGTIGFAATFGLGAALACLAPILVLVPTFTTVLHLDTDDAAP